jgi:hypothetical protein
MYQEEFNAIEKINRCCEREKMAPSVPGILAQVLF